MSSKETLRKTRVPERSAFQKDVRSRDKWVPKRHLRRRAFWRVRAFVGNARFQRQAFQRDMAGSKENAFQKDACSRT